MAKWHDFPHDNGDYLYAGPALGKAWKQLHAGDQVTFPDERWAKRLLAATPGAVTKKTAAATLAGELQEAWRLFHAGAFGQAVAAADACGLAGHAVTNKATGIYAAHLEPDPARQQGLYLAAVKRAEQAMELLPDDPNAWYFHAFNLGRYSQSISIVKALRQGIGGKVQNSLRRTLELEPQHAEAHTAIGLYHAEIIDKVGKTIGGLSYGASVDEAVSHFETALELTPESPIAHIEYANGLYLLFGDKRLEQVEELYVRAAELTPRDAMEKLDVELALSELE